MGNLVLTIRTACTQTELITSLIKSWIKLFGNIPSKQSICIVLAQHQIETGSNSCWNWNLCNVKYVSSNGNVDYMALNGVWEIINGQRVEIPASNPGAWFRSFKTLDEGCDFYLNFLSNTRYKIVWPSVLAGDPKQYSHLLKSAGFYTADETVYTNAIVSNYNYFMKDATYEKVINNNPTVSVWDQVGNLFGNLFKKI